MNGLTLRINGGGGKKTKSSFSFAPVIIPEQNHVLSSTKNKDLQHFIQASSIDQQLTSLKNVLDSAAQDKDVIKFLVTVFLQAEIKHPVKCFLTRYITKCDNLQQPFAEALSEEIITLMAVQHTTYKCYIGVVFKVLTCIENFPTGAAAVKNVEMSLAEYLKNGLICVTRTLSEMRCLSPTEKNEVFNLAHSLLRLVLYMAQKVSLENVAELSSMFPDIRSCLKQLLFDDDVPMDTKSVSGIVYVTMYILENDSDSWLHVLNSEEKDEFLNSFLQSDASRLCLYSAVATVVPTEKLQSHNIDGTPAIILLTTSVIGVGERTSSDSTFNLAVTRTVVQISKGLDKTTDNVLGLRLVDVLLTYVWAHLDHYMDSVRHLSAQALANIVRYCARLQRGGDRSALDSLFSSLRTLDRQRKSFYVSLTALTAELGAACVLDTMPNIVREVTDRLHVQAVQASATTALETLLSKQTTVPSNVMYDRWIVPIVAHATRQLESPELVVLEGLLTKVVKQDESVMDYILPHIKQLRDHTGEKGETQYDLKCVLMLLSVARKAGVIDKWAPSGAQRWEKVVGTRVLQDAAVSSLEQIRILSLSLVVESPKSTEVFTAEELDFVLYFLKYNSNSQAPAFRQLILSFIKKLLKRFEDSFKVLKRQNKTTLDDAIGYYVSFLEHLRAQCFDSLLQGANYGRRCVALQTLAWCEQTCLEGHDRHWKKDYVEKLLSHLEDSYENNKALALEILKKCPVQLLKGKKYSTSLELGDILQQASSVKPTDCVSAAYKLSLLRDKVPENILEGREQSELQGAEAVSFILLRRLLSELQRQLEVCRASVIAAARDAPMYGLLHCMVRVISSVPPEAISEDAAWSSLVAEIVTTCIEVNASVACVVNNSSPEGHLPMDMGGIEVTDHGNSGNVRMHDGRPVTAQMVLLCAWRSVKEVSLLLGSMCSRLEIRSESPGSLTFAQVLLVGDHFTTLLAETKHRGAFEQAYVGFMSLLSRLWRCRSPELHELPKRWLEELMVAIQSPSGQGKLCATRRSAGLPFMIQALVTTELQVRDNPSCFHACMTSLLALACSGDVTTRTHCVNVLRALVRNASLRDAVAPHVGAALRVALAGFEGTTWEERNSATLLFSALMVRVFGVQRSRQDELCARNRMTGRIFFLRYPELYDLLLSKLEEASGSPDCRRLRPALYPVLLLLARLYPSSLEGTVSNLKLVAFIPHVVACGRSAELRARRLAAAAMLPLVSPERYLSHLDTMLQSISDQTIKRNYCHGVLLQITRLLDNKPEDLAVSEPARRGLRARAAASLWALRQPCYVVADELLRMLSMLLWKFQSVLDRGDTDEIIDSLDMLLFKNTSAEAPGKSVCLANAAYLYFIILNIHENGDLCRVIHDCLSHERYEVVLSALNYILIMHKQIEVEDKFQQHLEIVAKADVLETLNRATYLEQLSNIIRTHRYLECNQKALQVLTSSGDTQVYIIQAKEGDDVAVNDDIVLEKLFQYIENEHESLTHIYLQSMSNFLTKMLRTTNPDGSKILEAIRVIFACSSADNSSATRRVVVHFLSMNMELLLRLELKDMPDEDKFEYKATLCSTLVAMLEDDDADLAQATADIVSRALGGAGGVVGGAVPSRSAETLRDHVAAGDDCMALLTTLALLDFKCEVVMTDEASDECRVFDQNERYNINLEETIWTRACAEKINDICKGNGGNALRRVLDAIELPAYEPALIKLCGHNLTALRDVSDASKISVASSYKTPLFVSYLDHFK